MKRHNITLDQATIATLRAYGGGPDDIMVYTVIEQRKEGEK